MKIEMGESLFYSWLRHVKECQIVQTNWKVSKQWNRNFDEELENLLKITKEYFQKNGGYNLFGQILSQIIEQSECDALGINVSEEGNLYYAVDVAFHSAGLNYGSKEETVAKVISKMVRTALCIYGYFGRVHAKVVFASPKINKAVLVELKPCIEQLNNLFKQEGYNFDFRLIANNDFQLVVLEPILLASQGIADTSELFIRSYQLLQMFDSYTLGQNQRNTDARNFTDISTIEKERKIRSELKIGKLAQTVIGNMLESGEISGDEIKQLQNAEYSKRTFDIQFPVLININSQFFQDNKKRYWSKDYNVNGQSYRLCSQWYEIPTNNDRPYLESWIESHLNEKKL